MSKVGVSLKINLSAVDQARLFQGAKGQYLDATVFIDLDQLDQYGNSGMITQDVTKEEKAQQVKGNILGNCKVFWSDSSQQQAPQQQMQQQPAPQMQQQQMAPQQQAPVYQPQQQMQQQAPQYNQQQPAPQPQGYGGQQPGK